MTRERKEVPENKTTSIEFKNPEAFDEDLDSYVHSREYYEAVHQVRNLLGIKTNAFFGMCALAFEQLEFDDDIEAFESLINRGLVTIDSSDYQFSTVYSSRELPHGTELSVEEVTITDNVNERTESKGHIVVGKITGQNVHMSPEEAIALGQRLQEIGHEKAEVIEDQDND